MLEEVRATRKHHYRFHVEQTQTNYTCTQTFMLYYFTMFRCETFKKVIRDKGRAKTRSPDIDEALGIEVQATGGTVDTSEVVLGLSVVGVHDK